CSGSSTSFTVVAIGGNLSYQWQENGINLSNTGVYSDITGTTLYLADVTNLNGKFYSCIISNGCGTNATSGNATLTVNLSPNVTDPSPVTQCSGNSSTFSVTATGA